MAMAFGFIRSGLGTMSASTPLTRLAVMRSASTLFGSWMRRSNAPNGRSQCTTLEPSGSSGRLRSPRTVR
jgi:hypothetical protein